VKSKHGVIALMAFCLATLCVANVAASGAPDKEATITYWTGYAETLPVMQAAAADYSKEHPKVKFEFSGITLREHEQKLQVSMSAGAAPDLADFGAALSQRAGGQGFLDPVPSSYASWLKENYEPVFTESLTWGGKIYGIPSIHGFQVLYYNLDDYAAAGITRPPATLDELMEWARKLTKYDANGKVTHSGISLRLSGQGSGVAEKWDIFLFANGGCVMQQTGPSTWKANFNNEAGYLALNFYLNALHKYKVDSPDVMHDTDSFKGGVSSQFNRETNVIGAMKSGAPNRTYGITQVVGGTARATNVNVVGLVVPSSGKNKDIAWDFAKFSMQDTYCVQMMRDVGWIYCRTGVDYSSVYAAEPHFKQALDRPAGFVLKPAAGAVSYNEVYTALASALTVAYTDASLMDNKPKIMAWLAAQEDVVNKILQKNKEF
jgi:multiple sugar transport system substrate-binding protein